MKSYYIRLNDKIYGPIDEEKIKDRLANGTFPILHYSQRINCIGKGSAISLQR